MRTIKLLNMLTRPELRELEAEIKKSRQRYLPVLFAELKKSLAQAVKPDPKVLFVKIFGRPYSKKEDYLIRNELRHLNECIYIYLVNSSFSKQIKQNPSLFNRWLLQAYQDRHSPLFWSEADSFIEEANENLKMDEVSQMFAMRELSVTHSSRETNRITIKERIERLNKWEEIEKRRLLYNVRRIEYLKAYNLFPQNSLEESAWLRKKPVPTKGQTVFNLAKLSKNDWYIDYMDLKKHYYQCGGDERLIYMKKLIELSKSEKAMHILGVNAHINNLAAMGLALLINGQLKEAEVYLQDAVLLTEKHPNPSRIHNYINYLSVQFLLDNHETVVNLCEKYGSIMCQSLAWPVAALTIAFSYLHLRKETEAIALVEKLPKLQGREVILQRYVYLAMFIVRGQYELAANELKNLKKLLSRLAENDLKATDALIASFYKTYIQALTELPKAKVQKIDSLKESIFKATSVKNKQAPHIELCWLQYQLSKFE